MDSKYKSVLYVFLIGVGIVFTLSIVTWLIGKVVRYVILFGLIFIIVSAYLYFKQLTKKEDL